MLGIQRKDRLILAPAPTERLRAGDVVLLEARPVPVEAFASVGLSVAPADGWAERLTSANIDLVEVLVPPRSRYLGHRLKDVQFRTKYHLAVVAVMQGDRIYRAAAADVPLRGGEALLVHGSQDSLDILRGEPDWLVLSITGGEAVRPHKIWLSLTIMLASLVAAVLGLWPVAPVFFAGALAMVLAGCLTMDDAYQAIEWRSIFLVGGVLPVGIAVAKTGAAALLGRGLIAAVGGLGPLATAAGLFLVTAVLNQFIPGGSTVPAVMTPIAVAAAQGLHSDPRAFALLIAVATGTSLLTPFAHPVNVLVMGPGGYAARDYLRLGLPLVLITFAVAMLAVHFFWHV